jgi:hypothetical protein
MSDSIWTEQEEAKLDMVQAMIQLHCTSQPLVRLVVNNGKTKEQSNETHTEH